MLVSVPVVAGDLAGSVRHTSGGAFPGAEVIVLTSERAVLATAITDAAGRFTFRGLPAGGYLVLVRYRSLPERQLLVSMSDSQTALITVVLDSVAAAETITVTADRSTLAEADRISQPVNVINAEQILIRARTVVAQAFEGETGVQLQRTSPGMAGVFVRGLTGNKVNIFVDGVRYSNGAQRGGVNTFLDLIDPATLDSIEVLRGTASAQYGSDALGGSVQFLTHAPALSPNNGLTLAGNLATGGETAHRGGFGAGTISAARGRFGMLGTIASRKTGDYRPGGGTDTHAAVERFLGLPTDLFIGERMPDTGFTQSAGQVRVNWLSTSNLLVGGNYLSSRQNGANRWDQILGGDGNLIAELNDLELDVGYVRVEKLDAGFFDRASATYSFNTQREERVNQGGQGDATASIVHQPERTTVQGVQFNASRRIFERQSLMVGGETYFEKHHSDSFDVNPATGLATKSRPRVPDGATYAQGGVFLQTTVDVVPDKLALTGALRLGLNRYAAHQSSLWPQDSLHTSSATFRLGAVIAPSSPVQFVASVSSGYRAPHMTDLGTLGLTGSGFEVSAPDLAGVNAFVGTTAGTTAKSTGRPVEQVRAEKSLAVDGAARIRFRGVRGSVGAFVNNIADNIQKQALILPAGAVGTMIGGQPVTSQTADGAVFVALSTAPVLVRANFDNARIWGIETDGEIAARSNIGIGWKYTYMRAKDTSTGLPPNIEGGTPAPGGLIWARVTPVGGRWWVQPYLVFASEQTHLSSLDATDRRTGASRTRAQIQNFFRRGARNRGWISADDTLIQTGETLTQIQDRVLGTGVNSSNLWSAVPAYALIGVRWGLRFGSQSISVDAENLTDQSYRGISWGMDGPGRGVSVRYSVAWR
jgi:hemoglobin/transferrin/lactoferrin receptor protein